MNPSRRNRLLTATVLFLVMILACSQSPNRRDRLPHGNRVEYKHGSKILIQPFADRDEVNYYQSELEFSPDLKVAEKTVSGHTFDLGSSAHCKISRQPPEKVVVTLIHEIPDKEMWHLPNPPESESGKPNASVDLIFVMDGERFKSEQGYQLSLRKDLPNDPTFYETLIVEVPFQVFSKLSRSQSDQIHFGTSRFSLDTTTKSALLEFVKIIEEGVGR